MKSFLRKEMVGRRSLWGWFVILKEAVLYLKEKKVTLAIAEFKKCLSLSPKHGLAYRSLGVAYYMLGRERSAVQAYSRFVELVPNHRDVPKVKKIIEAYKAKHRR